VINFIKGKMDEKELGDGMTWRELIQVLKEKGKVGAMPWIDLLLLLVNERSFFSFRKVSIGERSLLKENSSEKILKHFFEKALENPILKSRNA
jgi:hypothetical protein